MSNSSLVSIVIPCYNKGTLILETLNSVFRSVYTNYEVIIIDDGSDDQLTIGALKKIESEFAVDRQLRVLHISNGGVANARNIGLKKSLGVYVLFLDNDDLIDKEYIKKGVEYLENNLDVSFVYPDVVMFGEVVGIKQARAFNPNSLLYSNYIPVSCIYRKSLIENIRYNTELDILEDWDFLIKLVKLGLKGYPVRGSYLFYRINYSGRNDLSIGYFKRRSIIRDVMSHNNISFSFYDKIHNLVIFIFSVFLGKFYKLSEERMLYRRLVDNSYFKLEVSDLNIKL